jgi:hypothetical protein
MVPGELPEQILADEVLTVPAEHCPMAFWGMAKKAIPIAHRASKCFTIIVLFFNVFV